ncbi:MAG TPA: UpxY family transcription antiterminator [Candidatus Acidoferrum sp.]|nr:UpxY family transcription antiterminator [Candidatus Acidoferrum sp.]
MDEAVTVPCGPRCTAPGWYAVRTRGRHEKKVRRELEQRGFMAFLPTAPRWSRWKDRTKRIEEPLFTGYCFAQLTRPEHARIVMSIPSTVQIVGGPQGPEPIDQSEIDAIRRIVEGVLPYDPHPFLAVGMEVAVVRGPLAGIRGILVRKDRATRLVISIALIQRAAAVEIHPADVVPV